MCCNISPAPEALEVRPTAPAPPSATSCLDRIYDVADAIVVVLEFEHLTSANSSSAAMSAALAASKMIAWSQPIVIERP